MQAGDIDRVNAIADIVHPLFPERPEIPAERQRLFPDGCWIAEADGAAVGYAVCHAWHRFQPPALDSLLGTLPSKLPGGAECLYLHDIALLPDARGHGFGTRLMPILHTVAQRHGLGVLALTAVNGSAPYWQRQGFAVVETPALTAKLVSYGTDARYMERAV